MAVFLTTLALLATSAAFAFYSLAGGGPAAFKYLVPVLLVIALVGLKFAAPRLPWSQATAAIVAVFFIHLVAEHVLPLTFLVEKIVEIVCVAGFGAYWVKKGYIPRESNRWH